MNDDKHQEFLEFLQNFCRRPAMYLGRAKLPLVFSFLRGFSTGVGCGLGKNYLGFPSKECPTSGWYTWIFHKYATFCHPAWGVERIVYHENGHDEVKAIAALPALYEQFLKDREHFTTTDYTTLDEELKQKTIAKYGKDWGCPNCECDGWLERTDR